MRKASISYKNPSTEQSEHINYTIRVTGALMDAIKQEY
jgi:hypothetical protein